MTTPRFDTLRYVDSLIAAGVSEEAARASAEALNDACEQVASHILGLEPGVQQDISNLRAYVKQDINAVKVELAEVRGDIRILKHMTAVVIVMIVAVLVRSFF